MAVDTPGAPPGLRSEILEGRKAQKQEDQGPGEGRGLVQVIQDRLCRSQGAYSWLLARGRGPGRRHLGPGPSFLPKAPTSEFPVGLQLFACSQACCPSSAPRNTGPEATPSHRKAGPAAAAASSAQRPSSAGSRPDHTRSSGLSHPSTASQASEPTKSLPWEAPFFLACCKAVVSTCEFCHVPCVFLACGPES